MPVVLSPPRPSSKDELFFRPRPGLRRVVRVAAASQRLSRGSCAPPAHEDEHGLGELCERRELPEG